MGDELLKHVAATIEAQVREGNAVARAGTDDFVVVLANQGDVDAAAAAATRRILDALGTPCVINGHHLSITARAFVRKVVVEPDDAAICVATIQLSHNMRLKVVAEGVEGAPQAAYLRHRGCDEMQGYHFSHPVRAESIASMLRDGLRMALGGEAGDAQPTLRLVIVCRR